MEVRHPRVEHDPGPLLHSILGTGIGNVIVAITVPMIPNCARVVRSSALAVRQMPYVEAAMAGRH